MKRPVEWVEIDLVKLDEVLERAKTAPLSEAECDQLRAAVKSLAELVQLLEDRKTTIQKLRQIIFGASTEKTSQVLPRDPAAPVGPASPAKPKPKGHGRNGAAAYTGAARVRIGHETLRAGDRCPECGQGKVYAAPSRLRVRTVGQAPVGATVYELAKLRCNLCQEIFPARPPAGLSKDKHDATTGSMIALLKYGRGVPFYRLEQLQGSLGIPLPASTQWDIIAAMAGPVEPAWREMIRLAAQGEVLHNDDTTAKILALMKNRAKDGASADARERTGLFTTGIVAKCADHRIALFFTGRRHAGENLTEVLAQRAAELGPPIQMCDALSRNAPAAFMVILANCLTHGRRKFVDVAGSFPAECRTVLEILAEVYRHEAQAREQGLSPGERLAFHQAHSGPRMEELARWLKEQIEEHKAEPNSGLGKAITYMRKHWPELTLFLRVPGAPLDNNICERALKKVILHRKNALFYRTLNGAQAADRLMSLIHTCELNGADPFDYLTELQRHAVAVKLAPHAWLPWNYRATMEQLRSSTDTAA